MAGAPSDCSRTARWGAAIIVALALAFGTREASAQRVPRSTAPASPRVDPGTVAPKKPFAYEGFKLAPTLPIPKDQRRATVLTYLMTDDTAHQSPHSERMVEMMKERTPVGIHSVVFRDGAKFGDTRLFYMRSKDDWREPDARFGTVSLVAPGITEVQSNHPKVFEQVVKHTFDNYDGKRRYLQIYTHGGGVLGIGTDSYKTDLDGERINANRVMSPAEFGDSLRTALHGRTLDAIYFRACLAGNVETLYELRGTARYAIASQLPSASTENSNLTMTELFQTLAAKDMPPEDIVKALAIQAHAKSGRTPEGTPSGHVSIIAADLTKIDELKSSLNSMVKELRTVLPRERAAVTAAYDASRMRQTTSMGDLWRFTRELSERVQDPGTRAAVARVREAFRGAAVHANDAKGNEIGGLSIFMPNRDRVARVAEFARYRDNRFAKDTAWLEFVESLAEPAGATPAGPATLHDHTLPP